MFSRWSFAHLRATNTSSWTSRGFSAANFFVWSVCFLSAVLLAILLIARNALTEMGVLVGLSSLAASHSVLKIVGRFLRTSPSSA